MSAIGNYIHLNLSNYLKYGTNRYGEDKDTMYKSYMAQRAKNLQRINSIRETPPDILNELRERVANENTQKEAREIVSNMSKYNQAKGNITEKIKEKILTDVPKLLNKTNLMGMELVKSKLKTTDKPIDYENIQAARKARKRFLDNVKTINSYEKRGKIKDVQDRTINALLKNASDFFNNLGIVNNKLEFLKNPNLRDLSTVAALTDIIKSASLIEANNSALKGAFGEASVFMTSDTIRVKTGQELINTIEESLTTGEHRTSFEYDKKIITPQVQQAYKELTDQDLYQIYSSPDKVDASITINEQPVEASVKAYTPRGNIVKPHLQNVNLISSLIATEGQFANHWLNIHAHRLNVPAMDEELTKQIRYEALVHGNLLKQNVNEADTFVVIDLEQGRVKTFSTKSMLMNNLDNFTIHPLIQSISINNSKEDTWERRIAKILQSLHKQKISVSYRVSFNE